jgi:hypothetical protein
MNETQLTKTLQGLAHSVVRDEIVTEHFLCGKVPVSREELGAKDAPGVSLARKSGGRVASLRRGLIQGATNQAPWLLASAVCQESVLIYENTQSGWRMIA